MSDWQSGGAKRLPRGGKTSPWTSSGRGDISLPKSQQKWRPALPQGLFLDHINCPLAGNYFERDQSEEYSPVTQRPTLPIRHKTPQMHTAPSLSCPSCCQRLLHWQVNIEIKMARLGEPLGKRGANEKKWTESRASVEVYKENKSIFW